MKNTLKNLDKIPSRKEHPYELTDEQVIDLLGACVRQCLDDYCAEEPEMPKDAKVRYYIAKYLLNPKSCQKLKSPELTRAKNYVHRYDEWENNKASAELFFKSKRFKMLNLDLDYLLKTWRKIHEER